MLTVASDSDTKLALPATPCLGAEGLFPFSLRPAHL